MLLGGRFKGPVRDLHIRSPVSSGAEASTQAYREDEDSEESPRSARDKHMKKKQTSAVF